MSPLVLDEVERDTLRRWANRPKSAQRLALRAGIVLACADGRDNKSVAAHFRVSAATVGKWRARFVENRLEGLADEPRPGLAIATALSQQVGRTLPWKTKLPLRFHVRLEVGDGRQKLPPAADLNKLLDGLKKDDFKAS